MNNLNKDIIEQTLQDILEKNPRFLCFTDHHRLNILSWKTKKFPQTQILKIGDQKFIGFLQKDRNGEDYWKYYPLTENSRSETSEKESSATSATNNNNVAKFQQRLEKTQTLSHGKSNNTEQSVNQQPQPNS